MWFYRASWDLWVVCWMLPGAIAAIALATAFATMVSEAMLLAALGINTLAFGLYRLWLDPIRRGWLGTLFGVGVGLTSQIAHAGGLPFQIWVTPRRLDTLIYAGTTSVLFASVNWIKLSGYLAFGALNSQTLIAASVLMPHACYHYSARGADSSAVGHGPVLQLDLRVDGAVGGRAYKG